MKTFDVDFYRNFHSDLKSMNLNNEDLIKHYLQYGRLEGRFGSELDFYKLYPDFDIIYYKSYYDDLKIFINRKYDLMSHYHNYGVKEGRCINKGFVFNHEFYKNFHLDIKSLDLNENELKENYFLFGKKEGRICCEEEFFFKFPIFDKDFYELIYEDLSIFNKDKYLLMMHYCLYGFQEKRICSEKDFYQKYPSFDKEFYSEFYNDLTHLKNDKNKLFSHYINIGSKENRIINNEMFIESGKKGEYRSFCLSNMNKMKELSLPNFVENSFYESILIEYRCLPHLEFLIRNTIYKLGEKWSHSVICGNLNYSFMISICFAISPKIKVIKTDFDNLFPSDYSNFLASLDFWDLLNGEKILIYQEDTYLFKNNIEDFLQWDYIGAPWPHHQNDNKKGVGNGGFSLRSKSIMKKIINTISIENTKFNSSTLEYIKNTDSHVPPEDVYFSRNMEYLNIGLLADRDSAFKFSTESLLNNDSLGGHQFWVSDPQWKNRLIENLKLLKTTFATKPNNNQIQFISHYDVSFLEHRGGWKSVLTDLIKKNFFNCQSKYHFYDIIESNFLWMDDIQLNPWAGILHCTPKTPEYLNNCNLNTLFDKKNFKKSLAKCRFLVTLSSYITNFLKKKLREINLSIPIYTLKHPVETDLIPLFNYKKYFNNKNKKLLQIGQQLRKVTSIYMINSFNHEKIWLTGSKNFDNCKKLINQECEYRKINKNNFDKNVKMYYTDTFEEYDELLSENIVFIDLYDAAANNSILECIVRNTPIIINKIEPVIEYLGEDYPLYFHYLNEIPLLLGDKDKILKAHNYLKSLNKRMLSIENFTNQLLNITKFHFSI
jgi:hypothetical protein